MKILLQKYSDGTYGYKGFDDVDSDEFEYVDHGRIILEQQEDEDREEFITKNNIIFKKNEYGSNEKMDQIVNDGGVLDRISVAEQGYALDKLKNDKSFRVRQTVKNVNRISNIKNSIKNRKIKIDNSKNVIFVNNKPMKLYVNISTVSMATRILFGIKEGLSPKAYFLLDEQYSKEDIEKMVFEGYSDFDSIEEFMNKVDLADEILEEVEDEFGSSLTDYRTLYYCENCYAENCPILDLTECNIQDIDYEFLDKISDILYFEDDLEDVIYDIFESEYD